MTKIYRKQLRVFVILFLLGTVTSVYAQKQVVTGRITDIAGEGMPGVNVLLKGSTVGTTSDKDGNFSIEASPTDILVLSFIGYKSQEFPIGNQTSVSVSMEEDVATLSEIVVIGYGEMKRTDLSSSQVTLTASDIQKTVNTTLEQAIQGRAANVYVATNSGQPGAPLSVKIRGINSINGNTEPMYVVDGVQIMGTNGTTSNPLSGINPDDIESLNILQGPSATSVYGSRASNGVIVITTKRGKPGETKFTYNTFYTLQDIPKFLPTMNLREYAEYQNDIRSVLVNYDVPTEFSDPSLLGEGTNWQKELFQRAGMMKHQLSMSGGTEKTTFYLSGEYFSQDGVAVGSAFKRYGIRMNLDNQTRKWLKIGTNFNTSITNEDLTVTNDDLINIAISQSPAVPLKNLDGTWGGPSQTQFRQTNPVALALINENKFRRIQAMGGIYADVNIVKGLVFRTELNGNGQFTNNYLYKPSYIFGGFENKTATSTRTAGNNLSWLWNMLLRYNLNIGKHAITAMVSHEAQEGTFEGLTGTRSGFVSNKVHELPGGDAKTATNSSSKGAWAMESYFGRLNYIFNEKYIVQATLRADGSPSFGPENRWGYFPSVSAAWRISQESFMGGLTSTVNDLKLRVEYGLTGNQQAGGATYYGALSAIPTAWGTGYLVGNFSNPEFKWESTKSFNVGVDLHMFNNRIELIADAYLKKTDNLISQNNLPYYTGGNQNYSPGYISFPYTNIGALENRGFGVTLNTVNMDGALSWRSGLVFSMDRNKVTELYRGTPLVNDAWFMPGFDSRVVVGQPAWQFYGYEAEGLFQSISEIEGHARQTPTTSNQINADNGSWVGDIKYKDQNGDGVVNQDDRVIIGNPWPKFTFGFTNTFTYKNFELMVFLQGVYGNDVFNFVKFKNGNPNAGSNTGSGVLSSVFDYARVSSNNAADDPRILNPGHNIQRISSTDANGNSRPSQWFVEDGSFMRIKNVQLAYRLPRTLVSRAHLTGVRIAGSVQNLHTFTKYSGYDPEVGTFFSGNQGRGFVGVDYGRYPTTRQYNVSLQIEF
jgi:TonB-dependent starch-binding outer membrane protein SusC